jgi:Transposase IS116/IS110/IS902 family
MLMTMPGIGPITAVAYVAALEKPEIFKQSRMDDGAILRNEANLITTPNQQKHRLDSTQSQYSGVSALRVSALRGLSTQGAQHSVAQHSVALRSAQHSAGLSPLGVQHSGGLSTQGLST